MSELGECRECVTRKKDHSEKELNKCSYCEKSFCAEHMDAKHVHIPSFKATHKYARLVSAMKRDWERDGGHPCFQYSYTYSDQARAWEIKRALDRMTGGVSQRCEVCGREDILLFRCNYCDKIFCVDHHLPETHNCVSQPKMPAPYIKARLDGWSKDAYASQALDELERLKNVDVRQSFPSKSRVRKVRKIIVGFLKVLAFSIFTIATMLPTILYLVMMTLHHFLLWGIIIPNLGYLIAWVVVVYKVLRKRGKWWYYLILLGFGLWNWWNLLKAIWWFEFFRGIFGG